MKKFFAFLLFPLFLFAAVNVNVNGSSYSIPQTNERGWGNAVTSWIQAISANTLQPNGGTFTLTADVDFGANFGIKSSYLTSRGSNPATAGMVRFTVTDYIGWRNNANNANLLLAVNASDKLTFDNNVLATLPLARSDLGSGSADHVVINDGSGALSSEATLAKVRGGTGQDNSSITFPASGTLTTNAGTQTLTNKTITFSGNTLTDVASTNTAQTLTNKDIDGGTASNSNRITVPKNTLSNLSGLTRKQGTIVFDTTSNKPYYDDGSNLKVIGSGGGGVTNLIEDGDAEAGITNFVEGSYSAATRPAGTFTSSSGSGSFAISTSTSSPIFGNTSFLLTKSSGSSRQGRAIERTISIDKGYQAKVMDIRISYNVVSGSFVAGSTTADSSLIWYIGQYNGSTWTYTEPTTFKMYSNTSTYSDLLIGNFQTNYDTTQLKLIAYVAETANSAWVVKTEVGINPTNYVYGTTITDWLAYTPTFTGLGTVTGIDFLWRRVGSNIEVFGKASAGTVSGTGASITLPAGLMANISGSGNKMVGRWTTNSSTSSNYKDFTVIAGPSSGNVLGLGVVDYAAPLDPLQTQAGSALIASSLSMSFSFSVPISGWATTTQQSDGVNATFVGARYVSSNSGSWPTSDTVVNYATLSGYDTTAAVTTGASWNFKVPSSGFYKVDASHAVSMSGGGTQYLKIRRNSSVIKTGSYPATAATSNIIVTVTTTAYFNAGETIDIVAAQTAAVGTYVNTADANIVSIEKVMAPATMSFDTEVSAIYNTSTTSLGNGTEDVIKFSVREIDTHGIYNTSTGLATIPFTGRYSVTCMASPSARVNTAYDLQHIITVGASTNKAMVYNYNGSTTVTHVYNGLVHKEIPLNAGDTVSCKGRAGSSGYTMDGSDSRNYISIFRVK